MSSGSTGNLTRVLCKSNKCSQSLSHLSSNLKLLLCVCFFIVGELHVLIEFSMQICAL